MRRNMVTRRVSLGYYLGTPVSTVSAASVRLSMVRSPHFPLNPALQAVIQGPALLVQGGPELPEIVKNWAAS